LGRTGSLNPKRCVINQRQIGGASGNPAELCHQFRILSRYTLRLQITAAEDAVKKCAEVL
jgi:hypothetical protein